MPFVGQNTTEVFIINKGENYVGLVTTRASVGSTSEGLFFFSKGSNSGLSSALYNLESQKQQVLGDIDKVVTTVSTNVSAAGTTTHNLQEGDVIKLNVVPDLTVGINTTTPVSVNYNSEFELLLLDPISFTSSDVETNQLDLINHGFETGD